MSFLLLLLIALYAGACCHFLLQCMKVKSESEVAQSCPTVHDPRDCSLRGSSVHGIFQARILEWIAISSSRVSSQSRNQSNWHLLHLLHWQVYFFTTEPPQWLILWVLFYVHFIDKETKKRELKQPAKGHTVTKW